jgi:8-oxo-dGTP pyrophosphatase MutT (NUDIX family)
MVGDVRAVIADLTEAIEPFDERERRDREQFVAWCRSGADLFRTVPPATPPQHLAVYFVLLDSERRSVMLVEHRKAGLRLPPGGHVDDGEDPRITVVREAAEELSLAARFHPLVDDRAFFVTVTQTQGLDSHTDMTLWFLLDADRHEVLHGDPREFAGWGWVDLDDDIDWANGFDPQWHRFVAKLCAALDDLRVPAGR